jgi:hypothetical protein
MGTPIQHGALSPSDLKYYAPRKLRVGGNDPPQIQPSATSLDPRSSSGLDDAKSNNIAPLPTIFHASRESPGDAGAPAGFIRIKTLTVVASAAAVGIAVGIGALATLNFAQPKQDPVSAKEPEASFATRLQAATTDLKKVSQQVVPPTLVVADASGDINAPLPLGVEVRNYTVQATINLSGLPAGTVISAGSAAGDGQWRIAVDDLPRARVTPPPDYAGPMTVVAELRTASGQPIVRSPVNLTWRQKPAPPIQASVPVATVAQAPAVKNTETTAAPRKIEPGELAALLRRAEELIGNGDLPAARLLLQRVAETGNAGAAFRLATTYDPTEIKKFGSISVAPDAKLALLWYQRAREWGSPDASSHLEALASQAR